MQSKNSLNEIVIKCNWGIFISSQEDGRSSAGRKIKEAGRAGTEVERHKYQFEMWKAAKM